MVQEKAKSKAQQRFFGMVDAYKNGEMPNADEKIKRAADGMTKKEVKDFAKTKHKGLPNRIKKEKKKITESDLRNIIRNIIKENFEQHSDKDYFGGDSWSSFDNSEVKKEPELYGRIVFITTKEELTIEINISFSDYKKFCKERGFEFKRNSNLVGGYFVDPKNGNAYLFYPNSEKLTESISITQDKKLEKIVNLVREANKAFSKSKEIDGSNNCLMRRNGEIYGLDGEIKLSKTGRIFIPLTSSYNSIEYPVNEKIFSIIKGKCVPINDPIGPDDWNSCVRILKNIIADAKRNINHFQNYDPSWEEGDYESIQKLKQFNRDNGFNVNTGVEDLKYNAKFGR